MISITTATYFLFVIKPALNISIRHLVLQNGMFLQICCFKKIAVSIYTSHLIYMDI